MNSIICSVLLSLCLLLIAPPIGASPKLDIRPDCSERAVKIDEIVALAEKPEIKTMVQFLNAIPKGSLQTFTFVPNTRSLQHHKVDEQWPRVLRMSANGKIAMSFVCNPESQDYGAVEILHFEDAPTARWKSLSLKFEKLEPVYGKSTATSLAGQSEPRILRDSTTCLKCHGVGENRQQLRPIFAGYPNWPGFFGSEDDTLFTGTKEFSVFQQFKQIATQDPCYQTLPWPKKIPPGYEHYPYHALTKLGAGENPYANESYIRGLKTNNYHVRPNLKFTDTFSHLLAIRIVSNLLRDRDYLRTAPLLAMESLNCKYLDLDVELRKLLGSRYKTPAFIDGLNAMDPRSSTSGSLRLYTVAALLGVKPDEWTLHFNSPMDPAFPTGVQGAYGQDNSVSRLVQSLLLRELAKTVPGLKGNFRLSRGVSAFFKDQDFSCIDDLGGAIEFDKIENQKAMCESLGQAHREKVGERLTPALAVVPTSAAELKPKFEDLRSTLIQEFKGLGETSKLNGSAMTQMFCTACHGKDSYLPTKYHFLTSDSEFKKATSNDPLLLFKVMAYIENGRMPLGFNLKDDERRALQQHLLKTAGGSL